MSRRSKQQDRENAEKAENAAAIRALRSAGFTDAKIQKDHTDLASGWALVNDAASAPAAATPRGTGATEAPHCAPLPRLDV